MGELWAPKIKEVEPAIIKEWLYFGIRRFHFISIQLKILKTHPPSFTKHHHNGEMFDSCSFSTFFLLPPRNNHHSYQSSSFSTFFLLPPVTTTTGTVTDFLLSTKTTHLERKRVLSRPSYYVGAMIKLKQNLWVYENDKIVYRSISYVPALYQIFVEILVNAVDNKYRDPSMDSLKVNINRRANTVSVYNNGRGIPVEFDPEEKDYYIPELFFDHLPTSSHYAVDYDNVKKTIGSRFGYGAKLTNMFSTEFVIETADGCWKYYQKFTNNMTTTSPPVITKCEANENWTKVTFKPDLEKFKMRRLGKDVVALMQKRVLDMAEWLGKTVKVELNDQLVRIINSFEDYADLHMKSAEKSRPVDAIELVAFGEKKAEDRKTSIHDFKPLTFLDLGDKLIRYKHFVNKELILFSRADLQRSIPSMVDGLNSGQRNILFCSFQKSCEEINVGQLVYYVSNHYDYDHHAEQSLASTIIGMAQDFVGSNNINLLKPNGQFGTRNLGGKDHANASHLYTELNPITQCLFHSIDDKLLNYEDGRSIEPNWYIPIIPLILVNGSEGIGTGWSSYIPRYNPREIIANVRRLLSGEEMVGMDPRYRGFKGSIQKSDKKGEYIVNGNVEKIDNQNFRITELPIRNWTEDYIQFLESISDGSPNVKDPLIEDFWQNGDSVTVDFKIKMKLDQIDSITQEGLLEKFKLTTTISTSYMLLFDAKGKIKKFDSPEQILKEFIPIRLECYEKRMDYILKNLTLQLLILDNKIKFQSGLDKGEIWGNRMAGVTGLLKELKTKGFASIRRKGESIEVVEPQVAGADDDNLEALKDGYNYLISMPILNCVKKLRAEKAEKKAELENLRAKSATSLWMEDLVELEKKLDEIDSKEANLRAKSATSLWMEDLVELEKKLDVGDNYLNS